MKDIIQKHRYALILLIPGVLAGYFYWRYVGCLSGTCPIKSNWYLMILFGGLIGYLIGDSIDDLIKKRRKKEENNGQLQ